MVATVIDHFTWKHLRTSLLTLVPVNCAALHGSVFQEGTT